MLIFNKFLLFSHVFFGFLYMLSHGVAFTTSYRLKHESDLKRIQAQLDLSKSSFTLMYFSLLVLLVAGIALGFLGKWWLSGWIWVSLGMLLMILVVMGVIASRQFHRIRKAIGLPYLDRNKDHPAIEPASPEEIHSLLNSGRPHLLTLIGLGGWAVIVFLMLFRPF
jgi:hypothetical protein